MAEPRNSGNRADEIAEHESGADFSEVNRSQAPGHAEPIPVDGEFVDDEVILKMRRDGTPSPQRGVGELREGARAILDAQLFENESMAPPIRGVIEKRSQRGMLVWWAIRDTTAMAMWGDRVLIKRDTMASAYSCQHCDGRGHTDEICPTCRGEKVETFHGEAEDSQEPCRTCAGVLGYGKEEKSNAGFVPCAKCFGSGWAGGVVIPEIAESAPVSGIVVSIGPECVNLHLGDRVLHSKYAGHNLGTPEKETYTVMREHETLSLLRDLRP